MITEEEFKKLLKRVEDLEMTNGKLKFPLDIETISAIERSPFQILHVLILAGGLAIYDVARDLTVDPPKDGETWIEDISSVRNICFFRSNAKYCVTAVPGLISGVYTPTRSAETNLDANVDISECQYARVGNTVIVSGRFTADPTTTLVATSFEMDLPIASDIGAASDLAGNAVAGAISECAEIAGIAANNTAKVLWLPTDVGSRTWSFIFSYQVI